MPNIIYDEVSKKYKYLGASMISGRHFYKCTNCNTIVVEGNACLCSMYCPKCGVNKTEVLKNGLYHCPKCDYVWGENNLEYLEGSL